MEQMERRTTELLLAALIGDPRLQDAVLGDLAEEWAELREHAGRASADRWYREQVLCTAPHLIRAGLRGSGWRAWARAAWALAGALGVIIITTIAAHTAVAAMNFPAPQSAYSIASLGLIALMGICAGAVAAGLATRAPLVIVLSLIALWLAATVAAFFMSKPEPLPLGYFIALWTIIPFTTSLGGVAVILYRGNSTLGKPL